VPGYPVPELNPEPTACRSAALQLSYPSIPPTWTKTHSQTTITCGYHV